MKTIDYIIKSMKYLLLYVFVLGALFIEKEAIKDYKTDLESSQKTMLSLLISSKPRYVEVKEEIKQEIDTKEDEILATFNGTVSHYGPDCVGCIGITASGYNVKNTIYYTDKEYGKVRIVAADPSIPLGSILRLTYKDKIFHVIALDRGGAIGFNRTFILDLLCESEKISYEYGIMKNTKIEVLRYGY